MNPVQFLDELNGGRQNFSGVIVEGNLYLQGVRIAGGDLDLRGIKVEGNLYLGDFIVEGDLYLHETMVKGKISCGDDIALALQCFLYFGSRVTIHTETAKRVAQVLASKMTSLV